MPYCPSCLYEYVDGTTTCPDCHQQLVASLDNEKLESLRELDAEDWVEVARFTSDQWARSLLEVLRSKEIPAVILSSAGHFGVTGQMGLSSFRPIDGYYSLMCLRDRVDDVDQVGLAILGDIWSKSRLAETE